MDEHKAKREGEEKTKKSRKSEIYERDKKKKYRIGRECKEKSWTPKTKRGKSIRNLDHERKINGGGNERKGGGKIGGSEEDKKDRKVEYRKKGE